MKKRYLGDAVYTELVGGNVLLTTSDGYSDTNRILLDPYVVRKLLNFFKDIREGKKE